MANNKDRDQSKESLHLIWKRPDGFRGAHPSDFRVVDVGGGRLWLHKKDREQYPFKVSGGWSADDQTKTLNRMINALDLDLSGFVKQMEELFDHGSDDDPKAFIESQSTWITQLKSSCKGDTWEVEIMQQVLEMLAERLTESAPQLKSRVQS